MELPQDFKDRVRCQLGESYEDFMAEYEKERVYGLRYNPIKIERQRLAEVLSSYQVALEAVGWAEEGFYYTSDAQPGKLPLHEAGAYYIQEPSAMIAVSLLDPQPGDKVLDLCAAPGGKSTQIAGRLRGVGLLVSNEIIADRAKILSRNIERMGIANAVVLNETPERLAERFPAFFDRIVVDAPCSGEGMFRKDINAREEWSLGQVEVCAARQREILAYAAQMLKPGGMLVYSTCTFAPAENEEMAEWFIGRYPQFSLWCSEQIWPHRQRGEGHFAAGFCKDGGEDGSCIVPYREIMEQTDGGSIKAGWNSSCSTTGKEDSRSDNSKAGWSRNCSTTCRENRQTDGYSIEAGSSRSCSMSYRENRRSGAEGIRSGRGRSRSTASRESRRSGAGSTRAGWDGNGTGSLQSLVQPVLNFCSEVLSQEMAEWIAGQIKAGQLEVFGDQLYIKPAQIGSLSGLKVLRAGLQLGCCKKNRFEPSHALAMALRPQDVKQVLELEDPKRYLRGETVSCGPQNGWTLVTVEGCSAGWGKAVQGVLKNHYPKGLRRG